VRIWLIGLVALSSSRAPAQGDDRIAASQARQSSDGDVFEPYEKQIVESLGGASAWQKVGPRVGGLIRALFPLHWHAEAG
jgi:hypothetical protein